MEKFLKSGHFLIMGFNSRPAIKSAIKSGVKNIWGIDFFGDLDLLDILNNLIIMEDIIKENKLDLKLQDSFYDEGIKLLNAHKEISHVILTSGFDDSPDIWKKIENTRFVIGNSAKTIENVRNLKKLTNFCKKINIKVPDYIEFEKDDTKSLNFPIILKPSATGGGVNIERFNNSDELNSFLKKNTPNINYILQEFIDGIDISATISCNGKEASVLAITEQLLGLDFLGADSKFLYCGNFIPFNVEPKILEEITRISKEITSEFNLQGINGLDFILKNDEVYLIEVNPRFPGTMELIELITDENLFQEHVKGSFFGEISKETFIKNKVGIKFIIYAPKDLKIGDLRSIDGVHDITKINKLVKKGDPICSILIMGDNRENVWKIARKKVNQVYNACT